MDQATCNFSFFVSTVLYYRDILHSAFLSYLHNTTNMRYYFDDTSKIILGHFNLKFLDYDSGIYPKSFPASTHESRYPTKCYCTNGTRSTSQNVFLPNHFTNESLASFDEVYHRAFRAQAELTKSQKSLDGHERVPTQYVSAIDV